MAKELTDRQRRIRTKARKAAKAAGKVWSTLSKDERRAFAAQARNSPARERAQKAAADAGKKWEDLSREERHTFIREARKKP